MKRVKLQKMTGFRRCSTQRRTQRTGWLSCRCAFDAERELRSDCTLRVRIGHAQARPATTEARNSLGAAGLAGTNTRLLAGVAARDVGFRSGAFELVHSDAAPSLTLPLSTHCVGAGKEGASAPMVLLGAGTVG